MYAFLALLAIYAFAGVAEGHYLVENYCVKAPQFCDDKGQLLFNINLLDEPDHPCHEWEEDKSNEICTTALFDERCKTSNSGYFCARNRWVSSKGQYCEWDKDAKECYLIDDFKVSENLDRMIFLRFTKYESTLTQKMDINDFIDINKNFCTKENEVYASENGLTLDSKGNFEKDGMRLPYSQVSAICKTFGTFIHNNRRTKKEQVQEVLQ